MKNPFFENNGPFEINNILNLVNIQKTNLDYNGLVEAGIL